ncbi:hypothetical protein TSUD_154180 [Trifolium subterraneum]|uniref:Uncharacterized protein n=1 Tax=Trifolium subterraneum TaxID=3900 RepID=A0A2Z6N4S5_TRISU|nr:hypothetical protein TSUD_154180 [Trifolium subterraneum]
MSYNCDAYGLENYSQQPPESKRTAKICTIRDDVLDLREQTAEIRSIYNINVRSVEKRLGKCFAALIKVMDREETERAGAAVKR